MTTRKRIVIIGATSAIALHTARIWAQQGQKDFILIGRDLTRLSRIEADLNARGLDNRTQIREASFVDPAAIQDLVTSIAVVGPIDVALIAHGSLSNQLRAQQELQYCQDELLVNGVSAVLFAEAFATHMEAMGRGTIAVLGSVAGDRGRKSNYVYGAAKGLVTRYMQGLQHRFAGTGVKVVLIKPGPTETPMTAALAAQGVKMASLDEVSKGVALAIDRGQPEAYVPGKWWLIMMIIRHLPRFVFNKMNI
jgi:decaprenylphospho-beta-D-erythro-pentofuranosid-2-ulose 2-reductase